MNRGSFVAQEVKIMSVAPFSPQPALPPG